MATAPGEHDGGTAPPAAETLEQGQGRLLERIALGVPLPAALDAVARFVEARLDGAALCAVFLLDDDGVTLRPAAAPGLTERAPEYVASLAGGFPAGPNSGSCSRAAFHGRSFFAADIATDPGWVCGGINRGPLAAGLRACWSSPILSSGDPPRPLGTFALWYPDASAPPTGSGPPPEHAALVAAATHLARIAVERDRRERDLRDSREALARQARLLDLALDAARMGWWEWEVATGHIRWSENLEAVHGLPPGSFDGTIEGFTALIHEEDRGRVGSAIAASLEGGATFEAEFRVRTPDGGVRWMAGVGRPFAGEDGAPRMAGVGMDIDARKRAEAELARLYAREHRVAEALQRSLLAPAAACGGDEGGDEEPTPVLTFPGLSVACAYAAAGSEARVGGDFYDVFPVDGGRAVALVAGDVTGKGLDAAAQTAEAKFVLRAFLSETPEDPGAALGRLNRHLWEMSGEDPAARRHLVALTAAVVEPAAGVARFACAGAEPPAVLRCPAGGGGAWSPEVADAAAEGAVFCGPLVGALPPGEAVYFTGPLNLSPGDALLLTTDGVTEARRPAPPRALLGAAGAAEVAVRLLTSGADPRRAADGLIRAAAGHCGGALRDDACVLLAVIA
jgi:PAS domain S-box-containing protein